MRDPPHILNERNDGVQLGEIAEKNTDDKVVLTSRTSRS